MATCHSIGSVFQSSVPATWALDIPNIYRTHAPRWALLSPVLNPLPLTFYSPCIECHSLGLWVYLYGRNECRCAMAALPHQPLYTTSSSCNLIGICHGCSSICSTTMSPLLPCHACNILVHIHFSILPPFPVASNPFTSLPPSLAADNPFNTLPQHPCYNCDLVHQCCHA